MEEEKKWEVRFRRYHYFEFLLKQSLRQGLGCGNFICKVIPGSKSEIAWKIIQGRKKSKCENIYQGHFFV